jgi:hypothetical protein
MPNNKTKKHRTIQYVFKISTIIIYLGLEGYALVCNFGYAIRA